MNADTRSSIDALLATLKKRLAEPGTSLLPLLTTMSRFAKYSFANQCLIFAQRPDASRVQGYRAWQKAGYQVRKGEHGIAIYAPMRFKSRDAQDDSATAADATTAPPRVGFRVAYVFDIAQVEPLPGTVIDAAPSVTPTDAVALRAIDALKAFLASCSLELEYRVLPPGVLGSTDGRRITCALGQPTHGEFATLAHETAHTLLHFPTDGSARPDRTTRETEAEAVTYILCSQLGLDGTEASVDYIRCYRGTPDTLEASLIRIRDTAARLATALDAISFAARPIPD